MVETLNPDSGRMTVVVALGVLFQAELEVLEAKLATLLKEVVHG